MSYFSKKYKEIAKDLQDNGKSNSNFRCGVFKDGDLTKTVGSICAAALGSHLERHSSHLEKTNVVFIAKTDFNNKHSKRVAIDFYDWVAKSSPYAPWIENKSGVSIHRSGIIVKNVGDVPHNILLSIAAISRYTREFMALARVWHNVVKAGGDASVAFALMYSFRHTSMDRLLLFTDSRDTYDHYALRPQYMSLRDLSNWRHAPNQLEDISEWGGARAIASSFWNNRDTAETNISAFLLEELSVRDCVEDFTSYGEECKRLITGNKPAEVIAAVSRRMAHRAALLQGLDVSVTNDFAIAA